MNLGGGTFVDVSAVSGFDWDDDGRAAALVDWDGDGDLDVWLSNRNGPQVRFLRNQTEGTHHFLSLRLQGTAVNRDAIGARVSVFLDQETTAPIIRTLRAGDGFLSQASKWLHFGLGQATRIDRLVVRWPGGKEQLFSIPDVDRRYQIVEGETTARPWGPSARTIAIASGDVPAPVTDDTASSLCFSLIRLPAKEYISFSGDRQRIVTEQARLVLLNLWASWCSPCVKELQEFTENAQILRDHNIDVVALSVEKSSGSAMRSNSADYRLLERIRFAFRSGRADEAMLEKIQMLHDTLFELHSPLPLPTSLLIDRRGRVTAIYKGPVTIERILADASKLAARTTNEWRMATVPFSQGFWLMPPRRRHLFGFVEQLANRGYYEESAEYVKHNKKMLTTHPDWPQLSRKISQGLNNRTH